MAFVVMPVSSCGVSSEPDFCATSLPTHGASRQSMPQCIRATHLLIMMRRVLMLAWHARLHAWPLSLLVSTRQHGLHAWPRRMQGQACTAQALQKISGSHARTRKYKVIKNEKIKWRHNAGEGSHHGQVARVLSCQGISAGQVLRRVRAPAAGLLAIKGAVCDQGRSALRRKQASTDSNLIESGQKCGTSGARSLWAAVGLTMMGMSMP